MRAAGIVAVCCGFVAAASANGRAPRTDGIALDPRDPHAIYIATTFGLLVGRDGDARALGWICEDNLGYRGAWNPRYAVAPGGAIFATTVTGLRVSRDGGCDFATAAQGTPLGDAWLEALDLGPTGEVWVGTAIGGQPNEVYASRDGGAAFRAVGLESPTLFWKSVKVAPSNFARVYAAGYGVAPPRAYVKTTSDDGGTWADIPLAGVQLGAPPLVTIAAIDPRAPDAVLAISVGAADDRAGDRLYRTTSGGRDGWREVLATAQPIRGVAFAGARDVYVVTGAQAGVGGASYRSSDGGATFAELTSAPKLACIAVAADGALLGCAGDAIVRSRDGGATWTTAWRIGELGGPLACPAGTAEHDQCEIADWPAVKSELGATGSARLSVPIEKKSDCDAGGGSGGVFVALCLLTRVLLRRARASSGSAARARARA